jgi:hypothetical protein
MISSTTAAAVILDPALPGYPSEPPVHGTRRPEADTTDGVRHRQAGRTNKSSGFLDATATHLNYLCEVAIEPVSGWGLSDVAELWPPADDEAFDDIKKAEVPPASTFLRLPEYE